MLLPVPKPGWLQEKESNLPQSFIRNGSQLWVTWSGEHTFNASNDGQEKELCRIECPDPRVCALSMFLSSTTPAAAAQVQFNVEQGAGRAVVPQLITLAKGAGTAAVTQSAQVAGRIIIVRCVNLTPAGSPPELTVMALIAPFIPWWGL